MAREKLSGDQAEAVALAGLAAAIRTAPRRAGWTIRSGPGEPLVAHRADRPEAWRRRC